MKSWKEKGPLYWIAGIAAGLVILMLLCCGGFGAMLWRGQQQVRPVADEFLTALSEDDLEAAWGMIGPEWRAVQTEAEFRDFLDTVFSRAGRPVSWSQNSLNINSTNGRTVSRMQMTVTFENETGTVQLMLMKGGAGWAVEGATFTSPSLSPQSLLQDLKAAEGAAAEPGVAP